MKIVNFEVAKAIKELGFPQTHDYGNNNYDSKGTFGKPLYSDGFVAPTYIEVWLWMWREKKFRILLSASNQRWNEVHGIVDGKNGKVETIWTVLTPCYNITDHYANYTDPEIAIENAIEFLLKK